MTATSLEASVDWFSLVKLFTTSATRLLLIGCHLLLQNFTLISWVRTSVPNPTLKNAKALLPLRGTTGCCKGLLIIPCLVLEVTPLCLWILKTSTMRMPMISASVKVETNVTRRWPSMILKLRSSPAAHSPFKPELPRVFSSGLCTESLAARKVWLL